MAIWGTAGTCRFSPWRDQEAVIVSVRRPQWPQRPRGRRDLSEGISSQSLTLRGNCKWHAGGGVIGGTAEGRSLVMGTLPQIHQGPSGEKSPHWVCNIHSAQLPIHKADYARFPSLVSPPQGATAGAGKQKKVEWEGTPPISSPPHSRFQSPSWMRTDTLN